MKLTLRNIIGLVVFGSQNAFQTIVSLGGVAIQIGYFVPVVLVSRNTPSLRQCSSKEMKK